MPDGAVHRAGRRRLRGHRTCHIEKGLGVKLALGTVQFGLSYGIANQSGQVTSEEAHRILTLASDNGIDVIDTAIAYGDSERILGELGVDSFRIVTKLPIVPQGLTNVDAWIDHQIKGSLARLGGDSVYGLLLHRSENLLGNRGKQVIESLGRLKSSGLVQKIGVSIYDPSELDLVTQVTSIDIVQAPLSLVDRRLVSSGWLTRLSKLGVEVHTRSTFLQGLLLMSRCEIPQKFERWSKIWDAWHAGLNKHQTTPAAICLGYPLSLSEIDRVVVGVDTAQQLKDLIEITMKPTAVNDWSMLESQDEQLVNPFRWSSL